MEQYLELVSVPAIAAIVYWVIALVKNAVQNEKINRFIPLLAAALGILLGVVAFYAVPGIIPADNIFSAILVGGASGLTATGTDQIIKQLSKKKDEKSDTDKTE